jgi:sugar lactone lactonase YvrE
MALRSSELLRRGRPLVPILAMAVCLLSAVLAATAFAQVEGNDPETPEGFAPSRTLIEEAIESPTVDMEAPADLAAARRLPHAELDRGEALDLLESVFAPAIEQPAGIFDEMPTAKFITDNVAVMRTSPEELAEDQGDGAEGVDKPVLVESTLPLRAEDESGQKAPVDLSLEKVEGEVRPSNPIVATSIPTELHEGIEVGEGTATIRFPEASPERGPSIVEGDSAFYPNVQEDTDLLVTPIPTGVETLTQLRTPDAPKTQLQTLTLGEGVTLEADGHGGAEATVNGRTVLEVPPPTATDAAGNPVPVQLTVAGDTIELVVSPPESAAYPILVDPSYIGEAWNWAVNHSAWDGWSSWTSSPGYWPLTTQYPTAIPAMDLTSGSSGSATVNTGAGWEYQVPRYISDEKTYGEDPSSYLTFVDLSSAMFLTEGNNAVWPAEIDGIFDPIHGAWVSSGVYNGSQGEFSGWSGNFLFPNPGNVDGKLFWFFLITMEYEAQVKYRNAVSGGVSVGLSDNDNPKFTSLNGPSGWWNTGLAPITYNVVDPGLGISELKVGADTPEVLSYMNGTGPSCGAAPFPACPSVTKYTVPCTGTTASPCPRQYGSGNQAIGINPQSAPEGVDRYRVAVDDPLFIYGLGRGEPVSHGATETVPIHVDHSPPTLALTGTATEQGTVGTARAQYTLKYSAADGSKEPATLYRQREGASLLATFKEPADVAVDPSETLWVADPGNNQIDHLNRAGEPIASFKAVEGESLSGPRGIASDATGNIWVADTGHNRLVEFNSSGVWIRKVGAAGSGNLQFSSPQGVAVAPNGNVWVADTGNNRVEEITSTGVFVGSFDAAASPQGRLHGPQGVAVALNGNVWVADTTDNRIVELSPSGKYLASFGNLGSGQVQFKNPIGIDVDSKGNVFVVDKGNNRVEQLSERGEYLGAFGAGASFAASAGIATMPTGEIWVTSSATNRIQEWSPAMGTRSGLRSVAVKIDGKVLEKPEVTCPQGGCPLVGEMTIHSGEYAAGPHTLQVVATDGVNLTTTKTINLTLNPPAPSVALSGTVTEQASLGYTRPRYTLKVAAGAEEGTGVPSGAPSYVSSFGTQGSGAGQFGHPAGIAVDSEENLWIADSGNNHIVEYNRSGQSVKVVGSTGSGNGQFKQPKAIAIAPNGHFWVADAGNNRLDEFSPTWEFIRSVGSSGSGNGQFSGPEGIAIGPEGNMWVSDTYNHRVQEFNATGQFVRVATGVGSIEPTGITVTPSGLVWVTDWAGNRVVELNSNGALLRSVGTAGTGSGQFRNPDAVAVDGGGNVWVGDQTNARVEEFNQEGSFLGEFGAAGSGPGQFSFSYPMDIAADSRGNLWISDPGNYRVQRWFEGRRSSVKTEITVDGNAVDTAEALCSTETCSTTREVNLALTTSTSVHTLVVKATDGYGQWTSKTRTFKIEADKSKPALQLGGELKEAPEGWVQQESYGFNATASDANGYGVTSLALKIDGALVASKSQTCAEGGCPAAINTVIDMAAYAGGSHQAQVVAVDGAGNTESKGWNINVDPEGRVTSAEVTATLEAAETTSDLNAVGPSKEEEIEGTAPGLGVEEVDGELVATGSEVPTTIDGSSTGGFTVEVPEAGEFSFCGANEERWTEGESNEAIEAASTACGPSESQESNEEGLVPIKVVPLNQAEGAGSPGLVEENAVVAPNTSPAVDSIVRPLDDGGMVFQGIRDQTAPESYSYRVTLGEEQFMEQIDSQHAEVYYSGHQPAFAIAAVAAHDAIGTAVPTSITVDSRDVVTLHVGFRSGSFVYPIIAGTGWQGGFQTVEVEMRNPTPPEEPGSGEEEGNEEGSVSSNGTKTVVRLQALSAPLATASSWEPPAHEYKFTQCEYPPLGIELQPHEPFPADHRELLMAVVGGCAEPGKDGDLIAAIGLYGTFHYENGQRAWVNPSEHANCVKWKDGHHEPDVVNCGVQPKSSSTGITVRGDFKWPQSVVYPTGPSCETLYAHLNASKPHKELEESIYHDVQVGHPCPWPAWPH